MYSTLRTPQILELSGIGNKGVLEKIGVPVNLEVPGVGKNVQEHTFVTLTYGMSLVVSPFINKCVSYKFCQKKKEIREDNDWQTLDVLHDAEVAAKHLKLQYVLFTGPFINF